MRVIAAAYALCILLPRLCLAQAAAGTIAGVVRDPSGAVIVGARMQAVGRAKGQARRTVTAGPGDYSFPALLAGEYDVSAEVPGFQRMIRAVTVETGSTTTADFDMRVGDAKETVAVDVASPQMHYDSAAVTGLILRSQIEDLPLNGRSFLELAKLEPGVRAPNGANLNRTLVPILGAQGSNVGGTQVTVDGGSITSLGLGGSQMGLSQEVVQEFQVSTVNFDLSTGIAHAGAINVVTRSGGNDLHGTAFDFFRDHKLAAYPALKRDPVNPDPFFQRRQFGFAVGGPIHRDRVFYFGNWERNEQRGVASTTLVAPDFAHFSRITPNPLFGDLISVRLDGRISDAHTLFVRYSHDGSRAFGPAATSSGGSLNAYPSNWNRVLAWADQSLLGLTSVLRPTLVNDLRFSYFFISSSVVALEEKDCPGCLGIGAPAINIPQAGLTLGNSAAAYGLGRRFHLNDSITWQQSMHRVRFGADWEHNRNRNLIWGDEPATISLFAPSQVTPEMRIPLPAVFQTLDDILQLPLQSVTVAIGDPRVPQENGGPIRRWNTLWLYFQDTWRLHQRLTLNYGLGWSIDRILNYDLSKPALLAPVLGADGLGPTRRRWTNFSPMLGLSWAPSRDGKTVVRAAAGLYYALLGVVSSMDAERVALGAPGLGRQTFAGSSIPNPLGGVPGVPSGTALNFAGNPTLFTGADLMTILPSIRASLAQSLLNSNPGVQAIQINKQAAAAIFSADVPSPSALHASLGLQREIARDFVFGADLVYRHFVHVPQNGGAIDVNHFNSIRGAAIPKCVGAQRNDPQALCSLGPINVYEAPFRATNKDLLLRAEKRFSRGFQILSSYAYSNNTGTAGSGAGNGFNLDNWLQNRGPLGDITHVLNLAGVVQLPRRVELGLNFSYSSVPPFTATVGAGSTGVDFNGDGTTGDLLPGTTVNAFGRGLGRADLVRIVDRFNRTYAGTPDSHSRAIPQLTLPANYAFGDNLHSLDLRLSRSFVLHERWRLSLIGEVFNLYNSANLTGYSGDLTSAAFGQPTSRATQVFGSGGPRAFQLAMRVSF
jgi:hypothetical protein